MIKFRNNENFQLALLRRTLHDLGFNLSDCVYNDKPDNKHRPSLANTMRSIFCLGILNRRTVRVVNNWHLIRRSSLKFTQSWY